MGQQNVALAVFNRGVVDKRALGRVDVKRVAMAAETCVNWMPRSLGSMSLRPGLEYLDSTYSDLEARHIPFVYAVDDTAIIEITSGTMRVRVDERVIQRNSVSTAITNGTFTTDLTGWTDADESGATSAYATGDYLSLIGTRFNAAIRRQQVTVIQADRNVKHGLKIIIQRAKVTLKVGSTSGGDEYISETQLGAGQHSLSFTPTGSSFWIEFLNRTQYAAYVDSVAVEAAGDMTLAVPYMVNDLENLRSTQSADVIYVACDGYQQRKIERRGTESWSIVKYEPEDGPFRTVNTTSLTMTAGALTGDTTLTASRAYFNSNHVGALFRTTSVGQKVSSSIDGEGQWSSSIRVVGVDNSRIFVILITGTWVATVTLQRSIDDESTWTDVTTYTTNQASINFDDALDNQIIFYRIGVDTGDYTSGTAVCTLTYPGGGIAGIGRITGYTSTTVVNMAILDHMGQTTATDSWSEGQWSETRGWPTAVEFYEGRLGWAGKDKVVLSVSDAFESFDDEVEGESAPINRSIGSGPVAFINWLLPVQRLLIGTQNSEVSVRSTTLDEALTPTNFNIKEASTQGSDRVAAIKLDSQGIFVQRSGLRAYLLKFDLAGNDYQLSDLTVLTPDIGIPGIVKVAVQRQPDTRVHFLRADGTVAVLLFDQAEDIKAWVEIETGDGDGLNGVVEDIFVMPGNEEDVVYYCVKREINSATKRYLERMSVETNCIGGTYNDQADCFTMFINNPASATVSGLSHLEGESVVCWADGKCLRDSDGAIATFTVSSGAITLTNAGSSYTATQGIVGLPYTAQFKSAKLPYGANLGTTLGQRQRISQIALMVVNTHNQGLEFGRDFTNMDNLPKVIAGTTVDPDDIHSSITVPSVTFPSETSADARLCLEANAPRPCTVSAAIIGLETAERAP